MENETQLDVWRFKQMLSIPPRAKLDRTARKIREFYHGVEGSAYIAFSGGLDSSVVLHIARHVCGFTPEQVPAVFCDTGLEYPEVREVALRYATTTLRPKLTFRQVLDKYGYPVVSKKTSQYVSEVQSAIRTGHPESNTCRLRLTGVTTRGSKSPLGMIAKKWQYLCHAPFRVSCRCCEFLKKNPAKEYVESSGRSPILGMRATEGRQREKTFLFSRQGRCNVLATIQGPDRFHQANTSSWPLAIWTHDDVKWYVKEFGVDHACLYDQGTNRTGCMFCMFGVHMEKPENRFQMMYRTHRRQWEYCMENLGIRDVMKFLGQPTEPERLLL